MEDVQREHTKAEAQLALLDSDPSIIPPQREDDVLRESLNYKLYDMAWTIIRFETTAAIKDLIFSGPSIWNPMTC